MNMDVGRDVWVKRGITTSDRIAMSQFIGHTGAMSGFKIVFSSQIGNSRDSRLTMYISCLRKTTWNQASILWMEEILW